MKKVISLFFCLVACLGCSACDIYSDNSSAETKSNDSSVEINKEENTSILIFEDENVKISYNGVSPDVGIGEGLLLDIENLRDESIIVNISEVSLNDVMQIVIQPQMPLHLTSPGKKSTQPFVFSGSKIKGGMAQFKILILNENFEELYKSDFVEISL